MDPISLSALVGLIAKSAAGEAGKSAWEGLTALARRLLGHDQHVSAALEKAQRSDPDGAQELAGYMVQAAAADLELNQLLLNWMTESQHFAGNAGTVINTIGGGAHISGAVVQARDVGRIQFEAKDTAE